jgi:hypothetical protein
MSGYAHFEPEECFGLFEPKLFQNTVGIQDIIDKRLTNQVSLSSSITVAQSYAIKVSPALDQTFEANKNSFLKLKENLLQDKNFLDKFIVIKNGEMIDSDFDRSVLAERVYTKYGYIPIFIGKIMKENKYKELPSPEKVRN